MARRLRAPLSGQAADDCLGLLVEAEQVAEYPPVQKCAVGVGVCEIGWLEFLVPEVLEYRFGHAQLLIGKDSERTWPRGSMSWSRLPIALMALDSVWRGILLLNLSGHSENSDGVSHLLKGQVQQRVTGAESGLA